jgi:aminoglycoside phosphotransferase family enzyme/predicted kinase
MAMTPRPDDDFAHRLRTLTRPEAFPFAVSADQPIAVIQTHASAVLLAGERAYKLKKPENFGFFDYSTPTLRRHFCAEEVRLNTRLAPQVYLGVAPVLVSADGPVGMLRFGPTLPADETPEPGARVDGAEVLDYAVVMRRLPEEATLAARVRSNTASPDLFAAVARVARRVAAFHHESADDERTAQYGSLAVVAGNWEENLAQIQPYVGQTLDAATFARIASYACDFLRQRAALFESRVRTGCIRDSHGDLRLQHVYLLDDDSTDHPADACESPDGVNRLAIVDCIEFNERFRYGDVIAEVAFLAMELEAAARPDLARAFVDAYVAESGDEALRELLPFYCCYRACVRGKVLSFELDQPEVPAAEREGARRQAEALFALAAFYAGGSTRPQMLLIGGLMGTGKSTLAAALRRELGWALCSSDETRKRLAGQDATRPNAAGFGQGIYAPEWNERTYQVLHDAAAMALAERRSVILDASFARNADRRAAEELAAANDAGADFVECVCPPSVALERLAHRWAAHLAGQKQGQQQGSESQPTVSAIMPSAASDGRPQLAAAQRATWEPFAQDLEPDTLHLVVETSHPLATSVALVLDTLGVPRRTCWLAFG